MFCMNVQEPFAQASIHADKPDLNDLAVELCTDMRSTLDSRHRYLVLLGHWTEQLQATLMNKRWADRSPSKWRHPSKYGMVKQLIVGIGKIDTRAIQDILEHERTFWSMS